MRSSTLLILAALIALGSCATSPIGSDRDSRGSAVEPSEYSLRVDGESIILGDVAQPPMSLPVFVSRVQRSEDSARDHDTGEFIRTYPDMAEQAVLSPEVDPEAQQVIAAWMDSFASPAPGGWSSLVADREKNPQRYAAWKEQRTASWASMRRGEFVDVIGRETAAPSEAPVPWSAIDAASLQATAMLAAGRPADAAPLFEQTAQLASAWDGRVAVRANLYAALAYQAAGRRGRASDARSRATAGTTLSAIRNPAVLRLLLETHESSRTSVDGYSPRATLARLGRIEMERGAPQAALLAWRAAEAKPGATPGLHHLRLGQAEALIGLGQDQPAIAVLVGLARTEVRSEALVMMGLVQLRRSQHDMALAMLREAVDNSSAKTHPDVYADAGLALLSMGSQDVGLSLLHQARDVYQERRDMHSLRKLLQNELRYARATGKGGLAREARKRLLRVELTGGRRASAPSQGG